MKWPKINEHPTRTVSIPTLSGGVNLRDAVTLVNDNQLTDCKNMWYKDGMLKTRPGLYTNLDMSYDIALLNERYCNAKPLEIFMNKWDRLYRLFQFEVHGDVHSELQDGSPSIVPEIHNGFFWVSRGDIIPLPEIEESLSFVTQHQNTIYVFTDGYGDISRCNIYTMDINPDVNNLQWYKLSENEIYIPTVATNCKPYGLNLDYEISYRGNYGGVMFEGYNILSPYYKMIYSTVNKELLDASDISSNHIMTYELLWNINSAEFIGKKVKATITTVGGQKYVHEITITGSSVREQEHPGDNLYMALNGKSISFCKGPEPSETGGVDSVTILDYVENNLEIIAPYPYDEALSNKVFKMRECMWFGGDALGLSGGTRLFLSSNENENEKNLVIWSDLNRPTYFPENNYAYVGDSTQKVTAFGRQNDTLVIFKEHEIFYTQYARNSSITAEDLINQSIVDYTASAVYFPMIQLHSAIGCDCPRTVQLCRNYLVWASSDGSVYTLRSQNQYSERNIYCVSDMIKRDLRDNDLKNAFAADYDGHYFLFVGGNVYVMDYNSYGYININSYNKGEDAQMRIPWWKWQIPFDYDVLASVDIPALSVRAASIIGNELCCVYYHAYSYFSKFVVCTFANTGNQDIYADGVTAPVKSALTTKIFDFGAAQLTKRLPLVNIGFGGYDTAGIRVSFISDSGTEAATPILSNGVNGDEYGVDYVVNRRFRPSRIVRRFGVRIEHEGSLSVDSISLDYKILGGVK